MTSPLSRKTLLKSMGSNVESISSLSSFRDPSKNQDGYHQDYELPLDESRSLLFFTFNGTPIVQVVRREPQSKNPRTLKPSVLSPFYWLGLIARAMRAGYCVGSRQLLTFCGCGRYPARRLLLSPHRPSHIIRSKAHQTHLERNTWFIDRPTYRRLPKPEAP
ncbi:hypothetical protein ES705_33977 [subsurface metagenome]